MESSQLPMQLQNKVQVSALTLFTREDKIVNKVKSKRKKKLIPLKEELQSDSIQNQLNPPGQAISRTFQMKNSKSSNLLGLQSHNHTNLDAHRFQHIDLSTQEGQDTLQKLVESNMDLETIDESQIKNESAKNIIHAIKVRQEKNKDQRHSDFFYLLDKVNDRIYMYKSLFLEKRPRYLKDTTQARINSGELKMQRLKAQDEEKKQKIIHQMKIKQKKNQFYDNLSKKPQKLIKGPQGLVKRGVMMDQMYFTSSGGTSILSVGPAQSEIEELQKDHIKELARKEKLYSFKPKTNILSQRNNSQEPTINTPEKNYQLQMHAQQSESTIVKNDITYLSNLRNSTSLPYLHKFQVKDNEDPLQLYLQQRYIVIHDQQLTESEQKKAEKKRKKLLFLAEKKFLKLNQKQEITQKIKSIGASIAKTHRVQALSVQRLEDGSEKVYNRIINLPSLKTGLELTTIRKLQLKDIKMKDGSNKKLSNSPLISPMLQNFKPKFDVNGKVLKSIDLLHVDLFLKSARNGTKIQLANEQLNKS